MRAILFLPRCSSRCAKSNRFAELRSLAKGVAGITSSQERGNFVIFSALTLPFLGSPVTAVRAARVRVGVLTLSQAGTRIPGSTWRGVRCGAVASRRGGLRLVRRHFHVGRGSDLRPGEMMSLMALVTLVALVLPRVSCWGVMRSAMCGMGRHTSRRSSSHHGVPGNLTLLLLGRVPALRGPCSSLAPFEASAQEGIGARCSVGARTRPSDPVAGLRADDLIELGVGWDALIEARRDDRDSQRVT